LKALVATANRGKLAELRTLFSGTGLELALPAESGVPLPRVEETGTTYSENALLKARALADASGLPALADDSGLEVDALGGAPGVRSARYSGPGGTDADNNRKLLGVMAGRTDRAARFRCVLALVLPSGETLAAEGVLEGSIGTGPRGSNGFGYDPVFVLPDGRHVAELPPEEKQRISHRARAAHRLAELFGEKH
jgi:XTP/dITP diphosphohydrolase